MASAVRIRRATSDDAEEIAHLHAIILPGVHTLEEDGHTLWWIAETKEMGVAFAALTPGGQSEGGYFSMCGVLRDYRGQGLQKRLIRARIKAARAMGLRALVTDTVTYNPASANALIACGFRAFRPAKPWKQPGACYWRLEL